MAKSSSSAKLLSDIDAFLENTGMGESYFGKASVNNSELVTRLRAGGRVWPETEATVRKFMRSRRHKIKGVSAKADIQESPRKKLTAKPLQSEGSAQ